MPLARSRLVDRSHPIARWLYQALDTVPNAELVLRFADPATARREASALTTFRRKGRLGPPGTYPSTSIDPQGEGIGFFDRVAIGLTGCTVRLYCVPEGAASRHTRRAEPLAITVELRNAC